MEKPQGIWPTIMAFLQRFGEVMGGLVLGGLYLILLGPVAVVSRMMTDPLRMRRPGDSAFLKWEKENETVRAAQRQG